MSYGVFEIWTEYHELDESEKEELAQEALNNAHHRFSQFEREFIYESNEFFKFSKQNLESSLSYKAIVDEAEEDYSFWGISLFKGGNLTAWSGFGAQSIQQDTSSLTSARVTVEQNNNVTYLNYIAPLIISQNDSSETYFWSPVKRFNKRIFCRSEKMSKSILHNYSKNPLNTRYILVFLTTHPKIPFLVLPSLHKVRILLVHFMHFLKTKDYTNR